MRYGHPFELGPTEEMARKFIIDVARRCGGSDHKAWTLDFQHQAFWKFFDNKVYSSSGRLKGQTDLLDVQYWIGQRPSLMKNLVRSLRHLGPTYMLKWQWIMTQGKVPNTLTRLLWNRKVVSMPFNEFMAPTSRDVFNTSRILRLQNMWRH